MRENKILEIKFFLIPFAIFTFVLVYFENFYLFVGSIILFSFYYIYLAFKYKKLEFLTLLIFVANLSFASYIFFIYKLYESYKGYKKMFVTKSFIIDDKLKNKKYLLKDDFDNYFIGNKMSSGYNIGDKVKVYGYLVPIKLTYKDFYEFKNHFFSYNFNLKKIQKIFNFNYTNYLAMKEIVGSVYAKRDKKLGETKKSIFRQFRQNIVSRTDKVYSGYDEKFKALSLGVLIGDKTYLDKGLYNDFIHSGLVHIIVVSGGNIMFLVIFLSIVLFFVPFYMRVVIIIIAILTYAIIVGGDSSVIRATIMGVLSLIALLLGKVTDIKRILALAFIFMLIYNPYFLIYDLGFILSFLAILGILWANNFSILKKEGIKKYPLYFYNNYLLPTFGASLATAPAILLFTKQVNLFSFFASLIVIPFVPILMILSLAVLFIDSSLLLQANIFLMKYIYRASDIFANKITFFIRF